jgi:hypothetical protein
MWVLDSSGICCDAGTRGDHMDTKGLFVLKAVNDVVSENDPVAVKAALTVELAELVVEQVETYPAMLEELENVLDTIRLSCEFLYREKTEGSAVDYNDIYGREGE